MIREILSGRLRNWLFYTVSFALLPLSATFVVRFVLDKHSDNDMSYAKELLFFTVIICSVAGANIKNEKLHQDKEDKFFAWSETFFFFVTVICSMFFGILVYLEQTNRQSEIKQKEIFFVTTVVIAIFFGLYTTFTELLISRKKTLNEI